MVQKLPLLEAEILVFSTSGHSGGWRAWKAMLSLFAIPEEKINIFQWLTTVF